MKKTIVLLAGYPATGKSYLCNKILEKLPDFLIVSQDDMKEKKIAREERNQEKLANGDWVMAEFYATWCPHCQRMKPVVEEFKKLMVGTLEVVEVDIDQEPALTDFYTVESTPTFILFRKGQQLWRQSGEIPLERLERAVKGFKS